MSECHENHEQARANENHEAKAERRLNHPDRSEKAKARYLDGVDPGSRGFCEEWRAVPPAEILEHQGGRITSLFPVPVPDRPVPPARIGYRGEGVGC